MPTRQRRKTKTSGFTSLSRRCRRTPLRSGTSELHVHSALSRLCVWFGFVLVGLVWLASCPPSSAQTLLVFRADGSPLGAIAVRQDGDTPYITASDARQMLDGDGFPVRARYRYVAPTRTVTLLLDRDDARITLRMAAGNPEITISGRSPIILSNPPMAGEGDLWVPLELLLRVVPELLPVSVEYDATRNRVVVGTPSAQAAPAPDAPSQGAEEGAPGTAPDVRMPYFSTPPGPAVWTGLVVVIDPGHGGEDLGVQGSGLVEKDAALRLGREIVWIAQSVHGRAFLTHTTDGNVDFHQRAEVTAQRNATVFVSLHFNSSLSAGKGGFRLVVNNMEGATSSDSAIPAATRRSAIPESRRLADVLESALKAAGFDGERLELPVATVPELPIAAVHLEMAYVTNPVEARFWRDPLTRRYAAEAIWSGLAQFRP